MPYENRQPEYKNAYLGMQERRIELLSADSGDGIEDKNDE
jgi:hypothetical protein